MTRSGIATFTLDTGRCPPWLFQRMVRLGREMTRVLVVEYGPDEFIRRLADPVWFQSLGTVLAFDWNASGLTTILTAALKEAIREEEEDLGIFICGGKGKTSRKTPDEIQIWGETLNLPQPTTQNLIYNSKMAAKVDSSLVQDGYQLYHHTFFFSLRRSSGQAKNGAWTVVQQGMNQANRTARRYHWYATIPVSSRARNERGDPVVQQNTNGIASSSRQGGTPRNDNKEFNFVNEPHTAISAQRVHPTVLNLVSKNSDKTREASTELAQASYSMLMKDIEILRRHSSKLSRMVALKRGDEQLTLLDLEHTEFHHHPVELEDFSKSKYLEKILQKVTFEKPPDYESFVAMEGVGPKTVRALSLVSEVIYGAAPSYEDPARYSFAHGGKDATPYPVDRETYDKTISILQDAVRKTRLNPAEKSKALRRLAAR